VIWFLLGFAAGVTVGVLLMAALQLGRDN